MTKRLREDVPMIEKGKEITVNFQQNKRGGDEGLFFQKGKRTKSVKGLRIHWN